MRWAARTDRNQAAVVKALRGEGCTVESLHRVGRKVPDLLVGVRGRTELLEVKRPELETRAPQNLAERVRLEEQAEWANRWRGARPLRVYGPEDALRKLGLLAEK